MKNILYLIFFFFGLLFIYSGFYSFQIFNAGENFVTTVMCAYMYVCILGHLFSNVVFVDNYYSFCLKNNNFYRTISIENLHTGLHL